MSQLRNIVNDDGSGFPLQRAVSFLLWMCTLRGSWRPSPGLRLRRLLWLRPWQAVLQDRVISALICLARRSLATGESGLDFPLPERGQWETTLRRSKVVGHPGEYKPLILDEKGRVYLYPLLAVSGRTRKGNKEGGSRPSKADWTWGCFNRGYRGFSRRTRTPR